MNVSDAAYHTVHEYPGGSPSLAPRLGMSAAVLRGKVNANSDRNLLSLDEADRLMTITGDHRILHALAANHGYVLTPMGGGARPDVMLAMLGAAADQGSLAGVINRALADGRITPNELAEISKACAHVQERIVQVAQSAEIMAGASKPGDLL